MGGLGPGIGGLEYLVIAAVALIVVGPERLPGLLRTLGQWVGKARRMADEFRHSFDEMARQSELDDLRREVESMRSNQNLVRLGADADAAFKDIRTELNRNDAPTGTGVQPAALEVEPMAQTEAEGAEEAGAAVIEPIAEAGVTPSHEPKPRSRAAS